MILLIDCGNTRVKWRLVDMDGRTVSEGFGKLDQPHLFARMAGQDKAILGVFASTVAPEPTQKALQGAIARITSQPVRFCWSEAVRAGLTNSYEHIEKMGADRWHAMLGAWADAGEGFVVIDAGSAVTVDYVSGNGRHIGGYILPGLQMMQRSLHLDTARVGFEPSSELSSRPGTSTDQCVNHGLAWLNSALFERVINDARDCGLDRIYLTGGDGHRYLTLGCEALFRPGLVLDGLLVRARQEMS